jgi:AcrR family transcriptional regulator
VTTAGPARDQQTRRRILDVAIRQFAVAGFKQVTVRTICREARANVAAVNYHFRDKLGLYKEVLESAVVVMQEATEAAIRAGEGQPAEGKLRAYIAAISERVFAQGGDSWLHQLINREMAQPTAVVAVLVDRGMRPRLDYLSGVVGELLHRRPDDPTVIMCVGSIHAQLIMFRPNPISDTVRERFGLPKLTPETVADHIAAFSLAGMREFTAGREDAPRPRAASAVRDATD